MGQSLAKRTAQAKGFAEEGEAALPSTSRITVVFSRDPSTRKVDKTVVHYNGYTYEDTGWMANLSRYSVAGLMLTEALAVHSTPPSLSLMRWLKAHPDMAHAYDCDHPLPHLTRFKIRLRELD